MSFPVLGKKGMVDGTKYLSSIDPKLKQLLESYELPELKLEVNYFWSLCRSVIYQQISGKAAKTIAGKFLKIFPQ